MVLHFQALRFGPAFSDLVIWSVIFQSCIFSRPEIWFADSTRLEESDVTQSETGRKTTAAAAILNLDMTS